MADQSLTLTTHEANLLASALDERRSGARIRIMIDQDGVKVDSGWGWTPGYGRPTDELATIEGD